MTSLPSLDACEQEVRESTPENLPDLDTVVLGALNFLSTQHLPLLPKERGMRPLVIGSGNALLVGKILFRDYDAIFAEESEFEQALKRVRAIDSVWIISASGGKHAKTIASHLKGSRIPVYLITNTNSAPASEYLDLENIFLYPHLREPYTYNTSTYLSMIISETGESAIDIAYFIRDTIDPRISVDFSHLTSVVFVLPNVFGHARKMIETKFDELFGPTLRGRAFTKSELMHAKTIIPSTHECYFDFETDAMPLRTMTQVTTLPVRGGADYATVISTAYYVVGKLQRALPPVYKRNIMRYTEEASAFFGTQLNVIVD